MHRAYEYEYSDGRLINNRDSNGRHNYEEVGIDSNTVRIVPINGDDSHPFTHQSVMTATKLNKIRKLRQLDTVEAALLPPIYDQWNHCRV